MMATRNGRSAAGLDTGFPFGCTPRHAPPWSGINAQPPSLIAPGPWAAFLWVRTRGKPGRWPSPPPRLVPRCQGRQPRRRSAPDALDPAAGIGGGDGVLPQELAGLVDQAERFVGCVDPVLLHRVVGVAGVAVLPVVLDELHLGFAVPDDRLDASGNADDVALDARGVVAVELDDVVGHVPILPCWPVGRGLWVAPRCRWGVPRSGYWP